MRNLRNFFTAFLHTGKPAFPSSPNIVSVSRYVSDLFLYSILWGCSLLYGCVVRGRFKLYQSGLLKPLSLSCPVISIGNITTGGTGKSPTVIEVTEILRRYGKQVTILTRGYRRETSESNVVVQADTDVRDVGDEPLFMLQRFQRGPKPDLPEVSVIVGRQRFRSGQLALERFAPDVFLLDDGFQHIQLARTLDLVLIDATNPFGGDHLLPAGLLREPRHHLRRAHAFVITRSDEVADIEFICQQLHAISPDVPIFTGVHEYDGIRKIATSEYIRHGILNTQRLLAVSGLGNPESFHRLLKKCGLHLVHTLDFPDHHWYSEQDAITIRQVLIEHNIDAVITTEKDETKLAQYSHTLGVPCYVMTIRLHIQPEKEFEERLLDSIAES